MHVRWMRFLGKATVVCGVIALGGFSGLASLRAQGPQTYTLRGQVYSILDGLPLPNIRVALKGTALTGLTDSSGTFSIRGVPRGRYDLIAKYPNFDATILHDVEIPPSRQQSFVFNLKPVEAIAPLPMRTLRDMPDTLGLLSGTIAVAIDTFLTTYEKGRLVLRAVVRGNLLESYTYSQEWQLLAAARQDFRFQFALPRGKEYRLYLVWRERLANSVKERIVDVVRSEHDAATAATFDLNYQRHIQNVHFSFFARRILE